MMTTRFGLSNLTRYTKKAKVGRGAYGVVYRALDSVTGNLVAIKKIKLEVETEGIPSTALREITILRYLDDPNIVK